MRSVIFIVGAALILCILIIGALALRGTPVPDELKMVVTGCLTGLVGLLARPDKNALS